MFLHWSFLHFLFSFRIHLRKSIGDKIMDNLSSEKKMELIRTIRMENQNNIGKIRKREQILYGKTYTDNQGYHKNYEETSSKEDEFKSSFSSFKLRVALALTMFAFFLVLDVGKLDVYQVTAESLQTMINEELPSNLFDFLDNFPYTLESMISRGNN